ncbi:MAG: ribonuclease HII [Candidatus Omnitrophica bacterium]|nr:ribonuclease HII [Candidatus Omnitrophota bacterium]
MRVRKKTRGLGSSRDSLSFSRFDQNEKESPSEILAGVDEAGRGPLAGPVVAGAVIFFPGAAVQKINDSKKLSHKTRQRLFWEICRKALVGIGVAHEVEIDTVNIYQATRLAMKRAVLNLTHTPDKVLIDGNLHLDIPLPQKAIIRGDQQSASIAAASIIAKVYRDFWMEHLAGIYPQYGFQKHKGYATASHVHALRCHGPSPVHRRSFSPVADLFPKKILKSETALNR